MGEARALHSEQSPSFDGEVAEAGLRQLSELLGSGWTVQKETANGFDGGRDPDVWLSAPDGAQAHLVVQVKSSRLSPREAEKVIEQLGQVTSKLGAQGLVLAPYLAPRVRELLQDHGIAYLDDTGNASLRLSRPSVLIRTQGAQHDPDPAPAPRRGMSGTRAGALVRELVDFRPPRRGRELATATGLSEGYVSRLLELFADQALVRRRRGLVTEVDWAGLLRARSTDYDPMRANLVVPVVIRSRRFDRIYKRLRELADTSSERHGTFPLLMTGAAAADHYAPLTVGGIPMFYVAPGPRAIDEVCVEFGLMRINQQDAAEALLLQPMSEIPLRRPDVVNGLPLAGLSQVVLDCLSGPGRLPAAGNELLTWMEAHEDSWRRDSPLPT